MDSGIFALDADFSGVLWKYTVPAECTGVIFLPISSWGVAASQTIDLYFADFSQTDSAYPCFYLDGGNSGSKKTALCKNLKLKSQAGKTLNFVNMTNNSFAGVTAVFGGAESAGTVECSMTISENGLYTVTIPDDAEGEDGAASAYQTVYFKDENGNQLGQVYNFFNSPAESEVGVVYDADTYNTFYYGVTENSNGTKISSWGAAPSNAQEPLQGKTLYFDKVFFDAGRTWKLQIGDGSPVTLSTDSDDGNTIVYTFAIDTAATQQTLLTLIADNGTEYHFKWSEFGSDGANNLAVLGSNVLTVSGTYSKTNTVFFDASLSKLSYAGDAGDYGIPKQSGTIRFYATGDGMADFEGDMVKADEYSNGSHTWSDVYRADLPDGYTKITFSSFDMDSGSTNYGEHGESTTQLDIPTDIKNPCFYADSSDSVIYNCGQRGGYWDSVYTVRDAGKGKNQIVVDIPEEEEKRDQTKKYLPVTMYDFYTDYELNGDNRDNYGPADVKTHRIYQPFRQFNQALSSYYEKNGAQSPLYWGNFQNYPGSHYNDIRDALHLYGAYDANYDAKKFFYENNSMWGRDGKALANGNNATQGLVADALDANGNLMIQTDSGIVNAPFLDKSFLSGNNSKNTVLGKVYEDVSFPFTKKALESQSSKGTPGTVDYWVFDSKDSNTNLRMKQTASGDYFLDSAGNIVKGQTTTGVTGSGNFFPFNDKDQSGNASLLNYGFASKLEFKFRLTEDGTVTTTAGNPVPIEFNFAGDDDVWIFIDGKLALDIGGGHGIVSGYLNFKDFQYNVSGVKNAIGGGISKDVKGNFSLTGARTDEHTLTMFYMERGLWESNMYISYNFPDENSLEVEKQVDKTDVNPIFADLFDNTSLFTFFIKNQATHYGPKEVVTSGDKVDPVSIDLSDTSNYTLTKGATQNTFELTRENTIHWKALMEDRAGSYRHLRYGGIALDNPVDISKMKYLQYSFYYDYSDNPSLSNMYLYLVDSAGKTKGGSDYLSGKTYGAVTMSGKKWINVKIDLAKLQEEAGFNGTMVSEIRFGYNFPRDIYLKDFVFSPSAAYVGPTGFVTKQYDIPDYGSATSGKLEIPAGAQYVSSNGGNYAIGEDGTFVLQNGEIVTFNDQFRRGSYIALREDNSEAVTNLFTTSWTMYENGRAVTSMGTGDNDTVDLGIITNLSGIPGYAVDDGRTERYKDVSDGDGVQLANQGYTHSDRPKDEGGNPESAFVFRSYSYPASGSSAITKLKAVFTNKVRVGSLTITKGAAYKLDEANLKGEYTFKVSFTNVGGLALENEAVVQTVKLKYGESYTIKGIPLGTYYAIEEIAADGSTLDSVEIEGADSGLAEYAQDTKVLRGTIQTAVSSDAATSVTLTFKNTKKPTVNVSLEKFWATEDGSDAKELDSIWVQLQRRKKDTDKFDVIKDAAGNPVEDYKEIEVTPSYDEEGRIRWHYSITGLDKVVDYENNDETEWEYRFVELDPVKKTVLEDRGAYVITKQNEDGDTEIFRVTYSAGTLVDGTGYSTNMTNTLLGPVNLEVHKTSKDADGQAVDLSDVEFKLEMQSIVDGQETWGYLPDKTEDAIAKTNENGKVTFTNLKSGTYRLTEIKTKEGYTLLMKSVIVTIDRAKDTYTWKLEGVDEGADDYKDYSGTMELSDDGQRTLVIKISNIQNIQLPFTGGSSSFPFVAGGVLLSTISGVLYIEEKSRKMAKKKARRKRER